jgi:hypothetical protein
MRGLPSYVLTFTVFSEQLLFRVHQKFCIYLIWISTMWKQGNENQITSQKSQAMLLVLGMTSWVIPWICHLVGLSLLICNMKVHPINLNRNHYLSAFLCAKHSKRHWGWRWRPGCGTCAASSLCVGFPTVWFHTDCNWHQCNGLIWVAAFENFGCIVPRILMLSCDFQNI